MIDTHTLAKLRSLLTKHGAVQSLSNLPASKPGQGECFVLATMHSLEAVYKLQQQFGFVAFGFNSLIIPHSWLKAHLTDDAPQV